MDRFERVGSLTAAIQAGVDGLRADLWTALPAAVVSYNAATQSADVQPLVQIQWRDQAGVWHPVQLPVLPDCPVEWSGGGGCSLTFPLAAGDEGIVILASRCIDAWWSQGGVQPQAKLRMHSLSDGMFIPRLCSNPKVPNPPPSTTQVELRSDDGTMVVSLNKDTQQLGLNANGTTVVADGVAQKVTINAINGLWVVVGGVPVRVTVP
jgi:hypothetical protein